MTGGQGRLTDRRVVVGVDFSPSSIAAARWVAQHFAREEQLVLVHVVEVPPPQRFLVGRQEAVSRLVAAAREGAEARLRELAGSIATGLVWEEVRVGRPHEEIVRVVDEYDAQLVVVGRPAAREGTHARVGQIMRRLLAHSPVPVLSMQAAPAGAPSRLMVAVDDSDMTSAVLGWGQRFARQFDAEATVLHAVSCPLLLGASIAGDGLAWAAGCPAHQGAGDETAFHDVRDGTRWLSARLRDASWVDGATPAVVWGHESTADLIVGEAARRASDIIVVGSRGIGAVHRCLLGSVSEGILQSVLGPVLVVPPAPLARRSRWARAGVAADAPSEEPQLTTG